jgi:hypothetical protein
MHFFTGQTKRPASSSPLAPAGHSDGRRSACREATLRDVFQNRGVIALADEMFCLFTSSKRDLNLPSMTD